MYQISFVRVLSNVDDRFALIPLQLYKRLRLYRPIHYWVIKLGGSQAIFVQACPSCYVSNLPRLFCSRSILGFPPFTWYYGLFQAHIYSSWKKSLLEVRASILVVLNCYNAIFSTIKYQNVPTMMEPKLYFLAPQLQCTTTFGYALQLKVKKKKYIYIYIYYLCIHTAFDYFTHFYSFFYSYFSSSLFQSAIAINPRSTVDHVHHILFFFLPPLLTGPTPLPHAANPR